MTVDYIFTRVSYTQPNVVYDFYATATIPWPKYPKPEEGQVDVTHLPTVVEEGNIQVVARVYEMDKEEAFLLTH